MKKNHITTNAFRTIKKSFPRFLSMIIMSILGVLVFVGLLSTSPDMINTLDKNYDQDNIYDIKLISSKGLEDNDIEAIKKIKNIKEVEGSYSKDILIKDKNDEVVLNISSLTDDLNKLKLIKGRLPNKEDEIVVEDNFIKKTNYKIGDYLNLNDEVFKNKKAKIVGTISSNLYFNNTKVNQTRGSTNIATGTINYYSYMLRSSFDVSYYTNIYITVKGALEETTSKKAYLKIIEEAEKELNNIKSTQEEKRYQNIYNEASLEIDKKEADVLKELSDAENKLNEAKKQLDDGNNNLKKARKQLDTTKSQLDKSKRELTNANNDFNNILKQNNLSSSSLENNLKTISENIINLENLIKTLSPDTPEYQQSQANINNLHQQKIMLENLIYQKNIIKDNENKYQSGLKKYQTGEKEYQENLNTYNDNLKKYNENLNDFTKNKTETLNKLTDAKNELAKIEKPTWYIYDRSDDQTYASYIDQTKSIKSLAGLFPIVFYGVAILVSLISMNRMVEDDRNEIGTLKSLGFSNFQIMKKYLIFSLLATLIGGIIGTTIGLTFIPYLIFTIYRLLFDLKNFQLGLNITISVLGIILSVLCICTTTIITTLKVLKEKPSSLMRPKAPKDGKKILLEGFKSFWHKLNFSNKITIRNIFRYKKRVLITIFGIAGCTALMLCGFGIKDSIVDITIMQYGKTFTFDATTYVKDYNDELLETIKSNKEVNKAITINQISSTYKESNVNLFITNNNEELKEIVNLKDNSNNDLNLEKDKVIVTEKLASLYNIKENDTIEVLDNEKKSYKLTVSGIAKNYLEHYIYLDKETLEKQNKEFKPNVIYLKTTEMNSKEKDEFASKLIKNDSIINVVYTSTLMDSVTDMLNALNKVVLILILLAAMLSFVVLYNLSNINISERKREIATLKVLGFYDSEVDNYINKENIILTIIGIGLGLFLGYFLTNAVITTVEMEKARFIRHISFKSYLFSGFISISFTIIVNFVTHFSLKKIDMIESLKSVE